MPRAVTSSWHKIRINWVHCLQEPKWRKASFKKPEFSCSAGKPVLACFAAHFSFGQRCEKAQGAAHSSCAPSWQFLWQGFISPCALPKGQIHCSWMLGIAWDKKCLGSSQWCVCVYPFKQELNISASRRPFPFCLWFWLWRYSYRNGISAAGFLKASKCAVGWRYCLIYSRLTLTLPQFYTVLLHFAVRDAKPLVWLSCCTNLKLLN